MTINAEPEIKLGVYRVLLSNTNENGMKIVLQQKKSCLLEVKTQWGLIFFFFLPASSTVMYMNLFSEVTGLSLAILEEIFHLF